jgi:uncharacterized protein HemX
MITPEQAQSILSMNDVTIAGILIALALAFGFVIYYLFKVNQEILKSSSAERERLYAEFTAERDRLYKEHLNEIRSFNDLLIKVNEKYSDSIQNLVLLQKK